MQIEALTSTIFLVVLAITSSHAQSESLPTSRPPINVRHDNLPLGFEPNLGQTDVRARFLSRGRGYTAFLTSDGMVLSLHSQRTKSDRSPSTGLATTSRQRTVRFRLLGASKNPVAIGEHEQAGRVNYFMGNDPAKWRRNVPTYSDVRYKNVYPGIDLLYYGSEGRLEYDFFVGVGADPRKIRFEVQGAKQMNIGSKGALVLTTDVGELHFEAPLVYQESKGGRIPVEGGYILEDATHIRFQLGTNDRSRPLVIDPVLVYSTYLGGNGTQEAFGTAVDAAGNVYVAGSTDSIDFPVNTIGSVAAGVSHVFVAKLDPTGSNLIYCDYFGGDSEDDGFAIALGPTNTVYVTGSTSSSDFPLVSPYQPSYPGSYNAFLTKLSPDGSSLMYSTYFGGNGSDTPVGVAVDAIGDVIIGGYTSSTNLPVANAYQSSALPNPGGMYGTYGFVTKFSPDGSGLVYSTYLGGNSNVVLSCGSGPCWPQPQNSLAGLTLDAAGNVYVAGTTNTYNFPTTSGAYLSTNPTSLNGLIGFVSKFDSAGTLNFSTYFGGDYLTEINAIAVDASGSPYVSGVEVYDGTFPLTSTSICDPSVSSCDYAFVTKFDPSGTSLLYSTFLGPNNNAAPQAIAVDTNNDAYVVAAIGSGSFSTVNGIENYGGGNNILLAEIDPTASTQLFATYVGGSGNDQPAPGGAALDANGNIYIVGATDSTDFPLTDAAFQTVFGGNTEGFLMKVGPQSAPAVSFTPIPLSFLSQPIGSTSTAQTVLLRNMGSSPLSISSITVGGDFSETDNCGNSVAAAANCTFSISFTPTTPGPRSGSVVVQDDAAGAPHTINLTGIGLGASVGFTPSSLTFPNQLVGTSSSVETLALTNSGNATLIISSVQISGDFTQTNNCLANLSAGSNCTINVTFTPTVAGVRTGTITVTDNAFNTPQSVALTGTGTSLTANVSLSPASLTFPSEVLGNSSSAQTITVTNTGNETLIISAIQIKGDFSQTNNCSANLTVGASCVMKVTFTPTATGTRNGSISLTDNATNSPQAVALTGIGTSLTPSVSLSPASLTFSTEPLGSSSSAQTVTLSNTGNATLSISGIQINGDFSQTNNCSQSLAAGASCMMKVTSTPTATGTRSGSMSLSDNAANSPQVVSLSGAGVDFKLSTTQGNDTIKDGSAATYSIKVSPLGGSFPSAVNLSCSGLPADASCEFSSASVTPGSSSVAVTVTVTTQASTAELVAPSSFRGSPIFSLWMQLPGLGILGMWLSAPKRRFGKRPRWIPLMLIVATLLLMAGCAGGTGIAPQTGTPPGTYTIAVSGASGKLQHTVDLSLKVQ